MAAFFAWGNVPNSFAVANGSLLDYQNMPADYEGKFKMNEWNAMQLKALHTGPNGYHWAIKPNNQSLWSYFKLATTGSARGPRDMLPFLNAQTTYIGTDGLVHMGRGLATFVAFVPGGTAWFIRYNTNQCLWGPDLSAFPQTFRALVNDLEKNHPRKDECIDFVAFGLHGLLLARFENGNSHMALPDDPVLRSRISPELIREIEERLAAGWTLGNRTTLCEFDTNRWFLEWKRGTMAEFKYSMGNGEGTQQDLQRVSRVLSGVGSDAALVASHQNAQLMAANASFAQALALNRIL
ncbi:hypothetical protein ONZ43_g4732 [Nemania bipapillata]|uniref:Uncharacterized protein n=1 Tax=Nemania bipapillata TaxID=110536 RepID=A0ACC2IJ09_9PEZI|nr:hypothetical protein ONZ43_g4732 [Nemania bipapillata]